MEDDTEIIVRKKWSRNRILWFHGLLSATILGITHSIPAVIVAPETFNVNEGLYKLLTVAITSGIIGACTYLSKSPLPEIPKEYIIT